MARRVTREYVDDGGSDVVYDDRRPVFFNPVGAIVSLVLLGLLIWALFWGPIGEMFDGDGKGPKVDTPTLNQK
ncbi:MAG: hypothetical protein QOJ09_2847 [Actinomycetota bacterium]|jgi:hypothetical protein|nr:hypothetical protein [Actinomycetota bacterium]